MKCPECKMENIEGSLFCEECGVSFGSTGEGGDAAAQREDEAAGLVLASTDGSRLEMPVKNEIVVGREDPVSDIFPDLDLTGFGGMEKGVSRKHALIHRSGAGYSLEDLGSTNGTYINRKKVAPHEPQTIKAGDELRFGNLALTLREG